MKAVVYDGFGGADVLRLDDVPPPKYAQNDVLVKVRTAGVNPSDIALRSGAGARFIDTWFLSLRLLRAQEVTLTCSAFSSQSFLPSGPPV